MAADDQSMAGMLRWQARHRPDAIAIICGDQRRTYAALDDRSERIAAGLLARGLVPGDRVAVLMANCVEYLEIYQAAARSGLTLVTGQPGADRPGDRVHPGRLGCRPADRRRGLVSSADSGAASGVATGLPTVTVGAPVTSSRS